MVDPSHQAGVTLPVIDEDHHPKVSPTDTPDPDESALVTHLTTPDKTHATAVTPMHANALHTGKDSSWGISSQSSGLSASVAHLATPPPPLSQDHTLTAPQIHLRVLIGLCENFFPGETEDTCLLNLGRPPMTDQSMGTTKVIQQERSFCPQSDPRT